MLSKVDTFTGEVIGNNPNSRANVKAVLQNLVCQGELGTKRKWFRIGFDEVPYRMAKELKEPVKICNLCGEEVDKKQLTTMMHASKCHPGEDCSFRKYFENVFCTLAEAGHM